MSIQWQIRRGTKAELNAISLAAGELGYTTDVTEERVYVGDGANNLLVGRIDYASGTPSDPGIAGLLTVDTATEKLYYSDGVNQICINDPAYYLTGGQQEIDADKLEISWDPSNSTPTVVAGVSTSVDDLTSHLKGVDLAFGALGTISTQDADAVAITGGTITGLSSPIPVASGGTGAATLTSHGLIYGNGTSAVSALAEATDGQLPIGDSGGVPILATLTAGAGIDITNGAGSITIDCDLKLNGGIVSEGVANELAIDLGASAITGYLGVADGGTGKTSWTTNTILYGNGTAAPVELGVATNGQLIIGTGGAPALATLTAGTGIAITNGSGTISIAANLTAANIATGTFPGYYTISSGGGPPRLIVENTTANNAGLAVKSISTSTSSGGSGTMSMKNMDSTPTSLNRTTLHNYNYNDAVNALIEFVNEDHSYAGGIGLWTRATVGGYGQRMYIRSDGNITFTGTLGITGTRISNSYHTNITSTNAVTVDSDLTLKEAVVDLSYGLDLIEKLKPKAYRWKNHDYTVTEPAPTKAGLPISKKVTKTTTHDRVHYGLVAQDVAETMKELGIDATQFGAYCVDADTGKMALRYTEFIAPMIKSIQELSARVKLLEAK